MSKYASLLFSPTEYHEIAPFRFPIYRDLVPGEAKGIEEMTREQSKSTFKSIKIAQRIAKQKGITTKEAVELLSNISQGENEEAVFEFAEELEELNRDQVGNVETQVSFVTLFMQYRAEAQINGKKKWEKLSDWTVEDTEAMPSAVMGEIFQLILWERDGWPEEGKEEAEAVAS